MRLARTVSLIAMLVVPGFLTGTEINDHDRGNPQLVARLAYQLADSAEALENEAEFCSENDEDGPIVIERGGGGHHDSDSVTPNDHDDLNDLSILARNLHLSASRLYRIARSNLGGLNINVSPEDHESDSNLDYAFRVVARDFRMLERGFQNAAYSGGVSTRARILMSQIKDRYRRLNYTMNQI